MIVNILSRSSSNSVFINTTQRVYSIKTKPAPVYQVTARGGTRGPNNIAWGTEFFGGNGVSLSHRVQVLGMTPLSQVLISFLLSGASVYESVTKEYGAFIINWYYPPDPGVEIGFDYMVKI
jgi:hypothetical protein